MRRMKLTPAGRAVVFFLIVTIVICGIFTVYKFAPSEVVEKLEVNKVEVHEGNDKTEAGDKTQNSVIKNEAITNPIVLNVSFDEWIGWEPAVFANGGFDTKEGSIFDELGLNVKIHIINDAEASSNALIKGDLHAAGYTLNRTAFLSSKFSDAGVGIIIPVFTNYSDGGDGIIAMSNIHSIDDLVGAKIGVPKFSEAQSMVVWFINNSDLPDAQKKEIINNLILLDDAEQTGQAFFSGSLDVAATWQPYLSYAETSTDSHILFDTSYSNKLILDGIVFRKDFAEAHPDIVSKFIEGIFIALDEYEADFDTIRSVMPMFAGMTNEEIAETRKDAGMMGYTANINALENDCSIIYSDMCDVWESVGETVDRSIGETLFDTSYVKTLSDKYSFIGSETSETVVITEEQKEEVQDIPSMLTKSCSLEFHPDTAKFVSNSDAAFILDEFVSIAKILDGTVIQIEGNVNFIDNTYYENSLSMSRAETVKKYLIANGIDARRIITVGNGSSKMLVDPTGTVEDTMPNRRTDISFKTFGA